MSATMTMTMSPPPTTPTTPTTPITTTTMTTMTATTTTTTTIACCPSCGSSLPQLPPVHESHAALLRAQRQVEDLQAQVRLLNEKAAAAVDRWADYEDELSRLRAASVTTNHTASASTSSTNGAAAAATIPGSGHGHTTTTTASSPRSSFLPSGAASRLSQLLSPRRSLANLTSGRNRNSVDHGTSTPLKPLPHPHSNSRPQGLRQAAHITSSSARTPSPSLSPSPSPSPSPNPHQQQQHQQQQQTEGGGGGGGGAGARTTRDLLAALGREKELRRAAEGRLNDTSREVEELSVSLFEQANEMVAQERRARAKLEERVAQLETRDLEKRDRLDRLESALTRIERVRALLGGGGGGAED